MLLELLTPIAKSWPSEHCLEANKWAIQILGGYGYTRDYSVERHYRDNRLNHIHEGTFGIQGLDLLGRKVRLYKGRGLAILLNQILETIAKAKAESDFAEEAAGLTTAVDALVAATEAVKACENSDLGLANATLYLDGFGHVVVAWLWLKQAMAAQAALISGNDSATRSFYEGKRIACHYFFRYELPTVLNQFVLVSRLDDTCLVMRTEDFVGT